MITQEHLIQFYEKAAACLAQKDSISLGYYISDEQLLYDLRSGAREVWVEVYFNYREEHLTYKVELLEELEIAAKTFQQPCAMAVRRGMTLEESKRADEAMMMERPDAPYLEAEDYCALWIGDFDRYGAECGIVMNLLLPRPADAPPDIMTQKLIDRFGLDENGHLNVDTHPDHWTDLNTFLEDLADDDSDD